MCLGFCFLQPWLLVDTHHVSRWVTERQVDLGRLWVDGLHYLSLCGDHGLPSLRCIGRHDVHQKPSWIGQVKCYCPAAITFSMSSRTSSFEIAAAASPMVSSQTL